MAIAGSHVPREPLGTDPSPATPAWVVALAADALASLDAGTGER